MNVSQIFLCITTLTVAGTIACFGVKMYWKLTNKKNPYLMLALIKITLMLFLIPVPLVIVSVSYLQFVDGALIFTGDFLHSTTLIIDKVFRVVGIIWVVGCFIRLIDMGCQYYRLYNVTRGNIPVENTLWIDIFEEHKKCLGIKKASIRHNDLLQSPVVVGIFAPTVILPLRMYMEQELRIIFEHELNHLKRHDLIWKIIGIAVTAIHWFNPFVYMIFDEMMFFQEVVNDCNSTVDEIDYTTKDYVTLLMNMGQNEHINVYMTAIGESQNKMIRRIQIMLNAKKFKVTKKYVEVICCLILTVISILPTSIVTAYATDLQNQWIYGTENNIEVEKSVVVKSMSQVMSETDDDVNEVMVSQDVQALSTTVQLNTTIGAKVRAVYGYQKMKVGDQVTMAVNCEDESLTYRIGIKLNTGTVWYVEGTGTLIQTFVVEQDGSYSAFVQNMTNSNLTVSGIAVYP